MTTFSASFEGEAAIARWIGVRDERLDTSVPRRAARPRARRKAVVLAVACAALLVFLPSVLSGFVFDDVLLVSQNEYVQAWRWLPRAFATHLWDVSRVADADDLHGAADTPRRYYRPLVTVSFLLTWMLAGAKPWAFHLGNVLLHAATSALATRAAIRWTRSLVLGALVGGLFALHPTRTENVTWISGRMDVLMLLFALLALEALRSFERRAASGERRAWLPFAAGLLSVIASVLSKEPGAMLPLVLLARERHTRASRLVLVVVTALSGAYVVGRLLLWPPEGSGVAHALTPGHFLTTVGLYLQRALAPWPLTMNYYAVPFDEGGRPLYSAPLMAVGVAAIVAALVALTIAWRRSRTAFWLFIAAAAFIGPLLNLYSHGMRDTAQDRFLYAPLLFASAAVATLLRRPIRRLARRRAFVLAAGGVALAATVMIGLRTLDYRSDDAFWGAELAQNPDDPFVLRMVGRLAATRGDLDEAYMYFSRAMRPESRKYRLADSDGAWGHFQAAAVLAALLPDGRVAELRALLDELWRVVSPGDAPPRRGAVLDVELGRAISPRRLRLLHESQQFHWDAALLATRLGDLERAEEAVARLKPTTLASSPLNGVLVLARLDRISDARALERKLRARASLLGGVATASDFAALTARVERASETAAARDRVTTEAERTTLEALRLAELGAFFGALRALERGALLDEPAVAPLVLQLLVACRLDEAAGALASTLGPDGTSALEQLTSELPPRVRAAPPAPGTLDEVLATASREP